MAGFVDLISIEKNQKPVLLPEVSPEGLQEPLWRPPGGLWLLSGIRRPDRLDEPESPYIALFLAHGRHPDPELLDQFDGEAGAKLG